MSVNLRSLREGDEVRVRFNGSAVLGNEPYVTDLHFKEHLSASRAVFSYDETMDSCFEVYFIDSRWRYGTSSEPLTVLEKL